MKLFCTLLLFLKRRLCSLSYAEEKKVYVPTYYVSGGTELFSRELQKNLTLSRHQYFNASSLFARKWNSLLQWYHSAKRHSLWDPTEWSNLCLSWDWNNRHIYSWVTSIHRGQQYDGIMCPVNIHVSTLQRSFLYKFDFLTDDLNSLSHWYISCCSHFQVATSLNPVILSHTAS